MKILLSSRKHGYIRRLSLLLIVAALLAGMVGCEQPTIPTLVVGDWHTVGLKADGIVIAVGWNEYGQCNVGDWILN